MIHRPDLAARPVGAIVTLDGRPMRHVGEGCFLPAEPLMKRFSPDEGEPLHKVA